MAGTTNRLKYMLLGWPFRALPVQATYYVGLTLLTSAPVADSNTEADLAEIAAGNGYTAGGDPVAAGETDFDVFTEDDSNDRSLIQLKDIVFTASGGTLPASGDGARYMVLLSGNTDAGSREVYVYWDLTSARQVSDGQALTIQNAELRANES